GHRVIAGVSHIILHVHDNSVLINYDVITGAGSIHIGLAIVDFHASSIAGLTASQAVQVAVGVGLILPNLVVNVADLGAGLAVSNAQLVLVQPVEAVQGLKPITIQPVNIVVLVAKGGVVAIIQIVVHHDYVVSAVSQDYAGLPVSQLLVGVLD